MRESERAAGEYGCPNCSRGRRVYCAARDAVSDIRGSGLVGTCYDGVMAVWSSDSVDCRRTITVIPIRSYRRAVVRELPNARLCRPFFQPSSVPRAPEGLRSRPSAPERFRALLNPRAKRRRRRRVENLSGGSFLRSDVYLFKADLVPKLIPRHRDNQVCFITLALADLRAIIGRNYPNCLCSKTTVR